MDAMYDPWSTHLPALADAVSRYGGRVLEIGCGWYSTPLLAAMTRQAVTLETDPLWAGKFVTLRGGNIHIVEDIVSAVDAASMREWDVVFIDCEGDPLRVQCADIFINKKCCVVAHDTEASYWEPFLARVKYIRHYDFIMPRTSHLSNVLDVSDAK